MKVAEGDREDINRAVDAARAAFDNGSVAQAERLRARTHDLEAGDLVEKHAEEFAQLESLDNGKPLTIARVADVPSRRICSATWPVGRRKSKATRFRFRRRQRASFLPTRCASRWAWSARSFPGISRC